MRVLGIDPCTRKTGFGVIEKSGNTVKYITSGCIKSTDSSMAVRLGIIFNGLETIIKDFTPSYVAIEQAFVYKNVATAIKLGQARGAAMVAAGKSNIEVVEYTPRQIKQSVAGYGNAEKNQVQQMVKSLLSLSGVPQEDAADALAIALCHFNNIRLGIS